MILVTLLLYIFIILFFVGFFLFVLMQVVAFFTTDAPFVSIPDNIIEDIIKNLNLEDTSILFDLGCGDSKLLIESVKKFPKIQAVGIEKAFFPYILSKIYTRKYKNIEIRREDIFKSNISTATHIFLYLYPEVINRLIYNIREQCKDGTKIISCDFELNKIIPTQIINLENNNPERGKRLFIYKI